MMTRPVVRLGCYGANSRPSLQGVVAPDRECVDRVFARLKLGLQRAAVECHSLDNGVHSLCRGGACLRRARLRHTAPEQALGEMAKKCRHETPPYLTASSLAVRLPLQCLSPKREGSACGRLKKGSEFNRIAAAGKQQRKVGQVLHCGLKGRPVSAVPNGILIQ